MRFDTQIWFEKLKPGIFDPKTGNESDQEVSRIGRYASVTNATTQSLPLTSNSPRSPAAVMENTLTLRIMGAMGEPFDQIRIDNKVYRVLQRRKLRRLETFIVSEVQ